MRIFNHNLVLKNLKQVRFPLVSYIGYIDFLAFKSIWKKEKGGEMSRPERVVTLDIAMNVIPCISMFPISIVTFCRVIPWAL